MSRVRQGRGQGLGLCHDLAVVMVLLLLVVSGVDLLRVTLHGNPVLELLLLLLHKLIRL